ncbi:NACHT, LRR and PYD domains-containing protein 12-like [Mixophyes fleayi]|uniref:NACHT, LRR and PYD domains-containing protein 12-like n=1 Tax=Mixophyes fleayi TaxID=3061075 RepID=UPI003F4E21E5
MEQFYEAITNDGTEKFHKFLNQYEDSALRMIYEYYRVDFIYLLESLNSLMFFNQLQLRTRLKIERYVSISDDGNHVVAEKMVQDILEAGREAVIGFWKCLYVLQADLPHPNLLTVLDEIICTGNTLVEKILLDVYGHNLTPELKDIQGTHKKYLLEKTQHLVEHRPPRSTREEQSFYISERYVNMTVVSTNHFRQRSHELIETGRKHEDRMRKERLMLENISINKLFRWSCQKRCVPSIVMVSGVPGIGKTTLMQKFVYDWVTGKLYQRFAFVFFFKFRDLNRLDKISLESMILQKYPYLQQQIGNILQDPEKLLFIFDGLDESNHQMDFTSTHLAFNLKEIKHLGVIVVSLLRKALLNGCSVLITSRPTKVASLDKSVFQRVSEIMGFFPKERQMYFEQFFQDKILSEKAFHYVRENDTLYTFCYIPSYCWIICTVLSMCFKAQPTNNDSLMSSLPKTVTQLFVTFVSNILSNHSLDKCGARELLISIGWMAEHGVMNHFIVFDERDMRSFNVDTSSHLMSSFVMESDQSPNVTFSFLHLTIQEFFAALVHYLDYSPERLQSSLDKANIYTEIFLRFLCGFLDSSSRSLLKCLGEFPIKALQDVTSWLQNSLAYVQKDRDVDIGKFLNIFAYLFESQNRILVEESLGSNKNFTFGSDCHLTPVDCTVLAFVLKSCRETESLDLHHCNIQTECWERLAPVLHTIKHINLSATGLKDSYIHFISSALEHHECRIQQLILATNMLTDNSCSLLACAIINNQSLRKLDLSNNDLEGPLFRDLVTSLSSPTCGIEELDLSVNMLTDSSCSQLAYVIKNNQCLRKLDLSGNQLAGPHFCDLVTALSSPTCRIEELRLSVNMLTDSSCSQLAYVIKNNQCLRKLDLSGNQLAGPHFCDLVTALSSPTCRIEELRLSVNMLTDSSCSQLAYVIKNNQCLRKLDLSGNQLAGPHFCDLVTALSSPTCRIEELRLRNTGLTNNACHLAYTVGNNQSLRKLDLSNNDLAGPCLNDLMTALSSPTCRIKELDLEGTQLTDEQAPLLILLSNSTNLTYLDLSSNCFQDRGYNVIKELIWRSRSLEEIRLYGIGWSEKKKDDLMDMQRPNLKILLDIPY